MGERTTYVKARLEQMRSRMDSHEANLKILARETLRSVTRTMREEHKRNRPASRLARWILGVLGVQR